MDIAISVQNVIKKFGEETVLKDVSHNLRRKNPRHRGQQRQRQNGSHEVHLRLSAADKGQDICPV